MANRKGTSSAQIMEAALIEGSGKDPQERHRLLAEARDKALLLDTSANHQAQVQARYLEKALLSACMFGGTTTEVEKALEGIMQCSEITMDRREEFQEIARRSIK